MNTIQRIAKNTTVLFVGQFISSILALVLSVYMARKLGETDYGKYTFATSYVSILSLLSDMGYNTLMIREVSRNRDNARKYLNNVLSIRIFISVIIYTLIIITINLMKYPVETKNVVYIIGLSTIIPLISDVFRLIFRSFEKMEYEAFTNTTLMILKVVLGLLTLYMGYGLIGLSLIFLISSIMDFTITYLICKQKFIKPQLEFDFQFFKETLKKAAIFATMPFFAIIFVRIDSVMLSMIKGDASVGWYNAAYNLILGFQTIPKLVMNALFPLMSNYSTSSNDSLKSVYEKSFQYLFMFGLPLAVGITLLSSKIIIILYGQQYYPSIVILQILAWDSLLMFILSPLNMLLVSINREKELNIFLMITAIINVTLNLLLIPIYSYIGAALDTIICETTLFLIYFYYISKYFHKLSLLSIISRPIIASLCMGLYIFIMYKMNLFLIIISSIIVYFVIFYIIGGFKKDERELLLYIYDKKFIKKRNS